MLKNILLLRLALRPMVNFDSMYYTLGLNNIH
jgi:hypothetical protein